MRLFLVLLVTFASPIKSSPEYIWDGDNWVWNEPQSEVTTDKEVEGSGIMADEDSETTASGDFDDDIEMITNMITKIATTTYATNTEIGITEASTQVR